MINRYDLSPALRTRALFTVATSCKLWIARLAHKRVFLKQFFKENSIKRSIGVLEGNIIAIQKFCRSSFIIRATSCQKRSFC